MYLDFDSFKQKDYLVINYNRLILIEKKVYLYSF